MAAKEISVKKYVVRLSGEERERLEALARKGKSPAQRMLKARILLKADVSEAGEGWSDSHAPKDRPSPNQARKSVPADKPSCSQEPPAFVQTAAAGSARLP